MTDFDSHINSTVKQLAEKLDKAKEEYLLKVFGSIENARAAGAYFVIEDHGYTTEEDIHGFKLTSSFLLRPKTAEEIYAELEASQE